MKSLRADQQDLDAADLTARTYIARCDEVISALIATVLEPSLVEGFLPAECGDRSPLARLHDVGAAAKRAERRLDEANKAWIAELERLAAEGRRRNEYAAPKSIALDRLDGVSPACSRRGWRGCWSGTCARLSADVAAHMIRAPT